jgi:DNA transformation protein and related proteins
MGGDSGGFVDFVRDQLRPWAPVTAQRMFGGFGLYRGAVMFALIAGDTLYFRTDDGNRAAYEGAAMPPFRYERAGRSVALGYHEVPAAVLEEEDELMTWAAAAYAAALRQAKPRQRPGHAERRLRVARRR